MRSVCKEKEDSQDLQDQVFPVAVKAFTELQVKKICNFPSRQPLVKRVRVGWYFSDYRRCSFPVVFVSLTSPNGKYINK